MSALQWYLIAYDIREPRRLHRVQRYLRTCGYALQESVFAWQGDQRQLKLLQTELMKFINPKQDDVRGYPIPHGQSILWWGRVPLPLGVVDYSYPPLDYRGRGETHDD